MAVGVILIVLAFILAVYNIADEKRANAYATELAEQLKNSISENIEEIPQYILNPDMEMPVVEIDGHQCIGILEIPCLELELPVITEWSYPDLKYAPCRYKGSAYTDDLIIAGHNYSRHFGELKTLSAGDEIIFTDMSGNEFIYQVLQIDTLNNTDVDKMESGNWDLTLFTCTYGGVNRVTVRCERKSS